MRTARNPTSEAPKPVSRKPLNLSPASLIQLVIVSAVLSMGQTDCDSERLKSRRTAPNANFATVEHVFSPVQISAVRLEGGAILQAQLANGTWDWFHFSEGSSLDFNEPLPPRIWHCNAADDGCVARIRILDNAGPVLRGFASEVFHVCTEDYLQRVGRKHCGYRELLGASDSVTLNSRSTETVRPEDFPASDPSFEWRGDPMSRLVSGAGSIPYAAWHDLPSDTSGVYSRWEEYPYDRYARTFVDPENSTVSYDLGACSVFIPWVWDDRISNAFYTNTLGANTGNRGLAELFLDNIIERSAPDYRTEVNAMLWVDGSSGIWPDATTSPEFHFRLSPEDGTPQICLKQYMQVTSNIDASPDSWYRFDQAIAGGILSLFGVGECGEKSMGVFYCGTPSMTEEPLSPEEVAVEAVNLICTGAPMTDPDVARGTFIVDESATIVNHQEYPHNIFHLVCNNRVVPRIEEGVYNSFGPDGEGAKQLDRGIRMLVNGLSAALGLEIRRIEITPTGMYLITAEDTSDPQYGLLTHCQPDLERSGLLPPVSQPELTKEYGALGITRSLPGCYPNCAVENPPVCDPPWLQ